tara:strand:+ start:1442 stop:1561 length:120 start_codon:yes stop_codon:yes gene_type:complete
MEKDEEGWRGMERDGEGYGEEERWSGADPRKIRDYVITN